MYYVQVLDTDIQSTKKDNFHMSGFHVALPHHLPSFACPSILQPCACVIFPSIHPAGFCVPPPSFAFPSHICALNALPGCVTNMPPSTFKNAFISSLYSYTLDLNVSVLYIIRVPLFSYNFMLFCIHKLS